MVGIKRLKRGIVGILDDGTVVVCNEEVEKELRDKGIKVLRIGKIKAL